MNLDKYMVTTRDSLRELLLQHHLEMLHAGDRKLFPVDLFATGIVNRAVSLNAGFFMLLRNKNLISAAPLLRLQLDCALRLSAVWLVDKPHEFASSVMGGTEIRKLKDKNGQPLLDKHLVDELEKTFSWAKKVYRETSGFVHFTEKHIFSAFQSLSEEDRTLNIQIDGEGNFQPKTYLEAIEAFKRATEVILYFIKGWTDTKNASKKDK